MRILSRIQNRIHAELQTGFSKYHSLLYEFYFVFKNIIRTSFQINSLMDESIYNVIEGMALSFDDVMYRCWWQNKIRNCSKYFLPVFTEDGFCFTFNALNSHEMYTNE